MRLFREARPLTSAEQIIVEEGLKSLEENMMRVRFTWRDHEDNVGTVLFAGELYVGHIFEGFDPKKPWEAWLMTDADGSEVGHGYQDREAARGALMVAAARALVSRSESEEGTEERR